LSNNMRSEISMKNWCDPDRKVVDDLRADRRWTGVTLKRHRIGYRDAMEIKVEQRRRE